MIKDSPTPAPALAAKAFEAVSEFLTKEGGAPDEEKKGGTARSQWNFPGADYEKGIGLAERAFVHCVEQFAGSLDVVYTAPGEAGEAQPMSLSPPYTREGFVKWLEGRVGRPFPDKDFIQNAMTERLIMMMYRTHVEPLMTIQWLTDFPTVLDGSNGRDGMFRRSDLFALGRVVATVVFSRVAGQVAVELTMCPTSIAMMCEHLSDRGIIRTVLPSWEQDLESRDLAGVADLLETTFDVMDQYWKGEGMTGADEKAVKRAAGRNNQKRVAFILTTLGADVLQWLRTRLSALDVWEAPTATVVGGLELAIGVCRKWGKLLQDYTSLQWADDWKGPAHTDRHVTAMQTRLGQIVQMRSVVDQLQALLSRREQGDLGVDRCFRPFTMDPYDLSSKARPVWAQAVTEFERRLEPVEKRIAGKLRQALASSAAQPHLMLQEYNRYGALLSRPHIAADLQAERDALFARLSDVVRGIRNVFDARRDKPDDDATLAEDRRRQASRNMPGLVNTIVWCRQLRRKAEEVRKTAAELLADIPRVGQLVQEAQAVSGELVEYERELVKGWGLTIKEKARDESNPLAMHMSGELISLSKEDGKVRVNYSERLIELLREVRQLAALGIAIPYDIQQIVTTALRFYRHGVVLKQVAAVYNSMDQDMSRHHKAMMIDHARAFESIVQARKKITWSNTHEATQFVSKLQDAANRLQEEHRRLRKAHAELAEVVVELFSTDLLRAEERWRGRVRDMRSKVVDLEQKHGYKNMEGWLLHWDAQLYKALEHQYRMGLEGLSEQLSDIKCEVVVKDGAAAFRPPIEEVREQYYKRLKDFVAIPLTFKGLSEASVFKGMTDANEKSLVAVFQGAEALMQKLKSLRKQFKEYCLLGTVNLEDVVNTALTDVSEWEAAFKLVKQKGKEVSLIESVVKVECISVSTGPVKSLVEEQLQKLGELLGRSLRDSAKKNFDTVADFLVAAHEKLGMKPTTLDEIGRANEAFTEMNEKRAAMEAELHAADAKCRLLKNVSGTSFDIAKLRDDWEKFLALLGEHGKVVEKQIEKMKASVDKSVTKFMKDLNKFKAKWDEMKPKGIEQYKDRADIEARVMPFLAEQKAGFDELKKAGDEVLMQCRYFSVQTPDMAVFEELKADFELTTKLWDYYMEFEHGRDTLGKEEWMAFRTRVFAFDDFGREWGEKIGDMDTSPIVSWLRNVLEQFTELVPMLKFMRGEGWSPEHWDELFRILGMPKGMTPDRLLFKDILDRFKLVVEKGKEIKGLSARAQGEIQIRDALREVETWTRENGFQMFSRKERGRQVFLIKEWKEVTSAVGDQLSLLSSLKDSPYFGPFADRGLALEAKFQMVDTYVAALSSIQRRWVYLEPIFMRGALPTETERFRKVDTEFVNIMDSISKDKPIFSLSKHPEYKGILEKVMEQLDMCQKVLNRFLEEKRDIFPRFYFIGDEDLLEILGQSKNPSVIQSHLKKLFAGINKVGFDDSKENIVSMISSEGEVVPLVTQVKLVDDVEQWLVLLDQEMVRSLKQLLAQCVDKFDFVAYPSQLLCMAENIQFTERCEKALLKEGGVTVESFKAELEDKLREYTGGEAMPDRVSELKLQALIMDLIHNIDVVDQVTRKKVVRLAEWQWAKQVRFYLNRSRECIIRMVDAEFRYTYEYQGNAAKLVHTPLTDKCYLTLTQGMHLGFGGNPFGPAGTGKTESVKALGNLFARQVLVFNCDEGIDFKSMGRIFQGLVKCGAWGCFDEFNRLKPDQLSAISQDIQAIQAALKAGDQEMNLQGKRINVNLNAGIFVTLNPAGKNYGGRSKLPDNLKQLFRAVAMAVPDIFLITETMLYAEGFEMATKCATKLVDVFRLAAQLLSPQQHYDWGLRALKSILRVSGSLVRTAKRARRDAAKSSGQTAPPLPRDEQYVLEAEMVIKALRVNTLSKLTFDDSKKFIDLCADVFPGIPASDTRYPDLEVKIKEVLKELGLKELDSQMLKLLQLYEATKTRMGVGIVGPSGSGKSTLLKVLRKAIQKTGNKLPWYVCNPKAVHRTVLLGRMDNDTREWNDGIITYASRQVVKESAATTSWIVCDGDIDPEWIESLNSVLDDNRLLTMPNGERIQFGENVNFIFETHSLAFASPATVSRLGLIFLAEEDVDPQSAIDSWLRAQPAKLQENLRQWLGRFFLQAVEMVRKTRRLVVGTTLMGLVNSGLAQVAGAETLAHFVLGLVRGLGGYLKMEDRLDYARSVWDLCGERCPDSRRSCDIYWDTRAKALSVLAPAATSIKIHDLLSRPTVYTVDVLRALDVMKPLIATRKPFLIVGPEGAGKSMLVQAAFSEMKGVTIAEVNCTSQTNAAIVIQKLYQACGLFSGGSGRVLKPKEGDRVVLFLKDLNLPKPDMYATVELHSFLQQILLYEGFFDTNLEWIGVERVQVVGSLNPGGGVGRYDLAERFVAIVSCLYVEYPDKESLDLVYSEYLRPLLKAPPYNETKQFKDGKGNVELAATMVQVYNKFRSTFTMEERSHYLYTPRDLTAWVCNLLAYDSEQVHLLEAFVYEGHRIFTDKLVTPEDRKRAADMVTSMVASAWSYDAPAASDRYLVSWLDSGMGRKPKKGRPRVNAKLLAPMDRKSFDKALDKGVLQYQREVADMEFKKMSEVYDWVVRTDRVLSRPGGSVLFCGETGVGRKNVVSLVAQLLRYPVVMLNMSRDYGVKQFKLDLKAVVLKAGMEGIDVALILEDHNFVDGAILEMINSLLASGEVPGLLSADELAQATSTVAGSAAEEGFTGSAYQFFVSRVQQKTHVCMLMNPAHPMFEVRCQSNPALFTKCAVQWWGTWTQQSVAAVPPMLLDDIVKQLVPKPQDAEENKEKYDAWRHAQTAMIERLTKDIVHVHGSVTGVSPRMLDTFVRTFKDVYLRKFGANRTASNRFSGGLSKLEDAEVQVAKLSKAAATQKVELAEKQKEADVALVKIQKAMEVATTQRADAEDLKKKISEEQKIAEEKKKGIDSELAGVAPLLEAAKAAVSQIDQRKLEEVRGLASPPAAIKDVLEGVLSILGLSDLSWAGMKKFLSTKGVIQRIMSFDASEITPKMRDTVSRIIKEKENSYKPEVIRKASIAAEPLAAWCLANVEYSRVLERISPLTSEQTRLQENLERSREKLDKVEKDLKKLDEEVAEMTKKFKKMTAEAERLRTSLEKAEQVLSGAQDLIGKLSAEKGRWVETTAELKKELETMPALALVAAGYMVYLARADEHLRRETLTAWKSHFKLPPTWQFMRFMRGESELLRYKSQGLPADDLSFDNAVIILDACATVLIIDPSQQAGNWLRAFLQADKGRSTEFTTYNDERFGNTLELAVRFGKTLVVSEVDRVAPILYPMVRGDLMTEGPKKVVMVGDKKVDWKDSFKLFLLTRDPTLRLPPDARSLVTEVNFTITRSGLEGQLLGVTIQHEQPELEVKKSELLKQEDEYKMQLSSFEETLLKELSESKGSLLENVALIDSLNQIKTKSVVIKSSLEEAKKLQVSLDAEREKYRDFARVGSEIFFLMTDLVVINHMYQFSLAAFIKVFNRTLKDQAGNTAATEQKIPVLVERLVIFAYEYVALALFKEDRLMFGMHLARAMHPKNFDADEWETFIGGKVLAQDFTAQGDKGAPAWVPAESHSQFQCLKARSSKLVDSLNLQGDADIWLRWFKSEAPESKLPGKAETACRPFQRLLVMQAFRPDRLPVAMETFVTQMLKLPSLNPSGISLADLAQRSGCMEPVILIVTPGSDPSLELKETASRVKGDSFYEVGMGGGMMEMALSTMKRAASEGAWCCLKNLHLVVDWVAVLEKEISMLTPDENFRLWLTTEEHSSFPSVLLRQSLKMTFEAPPGLKKNLLRTYESWSPAMIANASPAEAQILFILAWFHGVVQERRTFTPQGWCLPYEFSAADLRSACDIIAAQCKTAELPDWEALYGLFTDAIYGGRIDNDFDTRILFTFLQAFFNTAMLGIKPGGKLIEQEAPSKRTTLLSKGIFVPQSRDHKDFLAVVQALPDIDSPAFFYLPANADKAVQKGRVDRCLENLRKLKLAGGAGGSRFDREIWKAKLGPLLAQWTALVKGKDELLEKPRDTVQGLMPIASFVQLQNQTGAALINMCHRQLSLLEKVLDGTALLSSEVEKVGQMLLIDEVPRSWDKQWEGPESASAFLRGLVARVGALRGWRDKCEKNTLLATPLALRDVFRCTPLLNALRQETARKAGVALDELRLDCAWGKGAKLDNCAMSLEIDECIIQGCSFENGKLTELSADSPNFSKLPPFRIGYTIKPNDSKDTVLVPVYLNASRASYVMQVPTPCSGGPVKWILAGAAIFFEQ